VKAVGRGRVPESRECDCGERMPLSIGVTCGGGFDDPGC
jgi:hypothetical protein